MSIAYTKAASKSWRVIAGDAGSTSSAAGSAGTIVIQNAQAETGDIATDYIPTTTAAVSVGPVSNVPRLDYLGSSCPRLLLEPQRTNVITFSEQIDNAAWTKINAPTITNNIATAPDGYGGADGIQDTTSGSFKRIRQTFSVTANGTHTASVFVKKETTQTNFGGLSLTFTGATTRYAYGIIDPINGTIVVSSDSIIASSSTKVEDYGTYWRFSLTATDNQSNTTLEIAYYGTISTNGTSTGLGAGSVRTIWGLQLEIAGAYSTSYIPTLAASVTRVADAASKTGISSLIGQTEGTLFGEFVFDSSENVNRVFSITGTDWNANGSIRLDIVSNKPEFYARKAGSDIGSQGAINYTIAKGQTVKWALVYTASTIKLFIDGAQRGTTTSLSTTPPACGQLFVNELGGGFSNANQNNQRTFWKQVLLFTSALTDAQCIELTTL